MLLSISVFAGMLGLAGSLAVFGWILYVPTSVRIFGETPWLCAKRRRPLKDAEEHRFQADDGLTLQGTYLPATGPERRGVIVFCHELFGDRWSALPYVDRLRRSGFGVFTFDFRNHGESDRQADYHPLPWLTTRELADVRAAVDYVGSRIEAARAGIGLMGVSKGANAALCQAAGDPRITAVVADSPFPVGAMQRHYSRRFTRIYFPFPRIGKRLPDWFLDSLGVWARVLVGRRLRSRIVNVERTARRVRQPVFFIHGGRDRYVPEPLVRLLRGRLAGRSKLWLVPGARHNEAIVSAADRYHRRVGRFFLRRVAGPHSRLRASPVLEAPPPRPEKRAPDSSRGGRKKPRRPGRAKLASTTS